MAPGPKLLGFAGGGGSVPASDWEFPPADVPVESLRLRFALLQSLNTTLETFFLPLVELRQTEMYGNSIAALLQEAKGQLGTDPGALTTGHFSLGLLLKERGIILVSSSWTP